MEYSIELLTDPAKHGNEITQLLKDVYVAEGFTDAEFAEKTFAFSEIFRRGELYVARERTTGEIVGMVILGSPENHARQVAQPGEAEIQLLAVKKECRGAGLGARLVDACLKRAKSLKYGRVVLSTQPAMKAAQKTYERLGFDRSSARDWSARGRSFLVYERST
jgi:ribosomal protein S18 acetylase RimI-like enzyme